MKFTLACVFTFAVLSINQALSIPLLDKRGSVCKNQEKIDGKQVESGSCSDVLQGEIPSVDHMVSTIITNPSDHKTLSANKPFQIEIFVSNLETGHFSDPDKEYYASSQELDSS